MSTKKWRDPGMRRVRLLVWRLFRHTPLDRRIDEAAERAASEHCHLQWSEYLALKAEHAHLWRRGAIKRMKAQISGQIIEQPAQLKLYRQRQAPAKAKMRRADQAAPGGEGMTKRVALAGSTRKTARGSCSGAI